MLIQLPNKDWFKAENVTRITSIGREVRIWFDGVPLLIPALKTNKEADEYKDYLAAKINEATRQSHRPVPDTTPQASQEP